VARGAVERAVPLEGVDEARHDLERLSFVQGGRGVREGWTRGTDVEGSVRTREREGERERERERGRERERERERGTDVEGSVQTRGGHCEGFLVCRRTHTFTVTGCTRKSTGSRWHTIFTAPASAPAPAVAPAAAAAAWKGSGPRTSQQTSWTRAGTSSCRFFRMKASSAVSKAGPRSSVSSCRQTLAGGGVGSIEGDQIRSDRGRDRGRGMWRPPENHARTHAPLSRTPGP